MAKGDFRAAVAAAEALLRTSPTDAEAMRIKGEAEKQVAAVKVTEEKYQAAVKAAQVALGRKDYSTAVTQADAALAVRANDGEAMRIKGEAEKQVAAAKVADEKYRTAV